MANEKITDQKTYIEKDQSTIMKNLVKDFSSPIIPVKNTSFVPPVIVHQYPKEKNSQEKISVKASASHTKLDLILNSVDSLNAFKKFLQKELSSENLAFILAVNAVEKSLPPNPVLQDKYIQDKLKTIHKYYTKDDAKFLVNLPYEINLNCQPKKDTGRFELEAYKSAVSNIKKLMENDSIPRFIGEQEKNIPPTRPRRH